MKKRILLIAVLAAIFAFIFVIGASAETPNMYIEFGAKFPESDGYITVYTENAETSGNPQINFATKKFYSDVEFTNEVDMSTATGIDFSVAKTYVGGVQGNAPTRMTKPSSPFTNCVEVKWFLAGMPTVSYNSAFFQGWTGLKSFDFGNATAIADNTFQDCGFESITIPASITSIGGSAFKGCTSLTSVKFEGNITRFNNGATFSGCTSLTTVDFGNTTTVCNSMFNGCTALTSITLPSGITTIENQAFLSCSNLTSITLNEGLKSIGSRAFEGTALTSITVPSTVDTISEKAFYSLKTLASVTFAGNSSLETIGKEAFCYVPASNLTVPSTVTSIGSSAFYESGITSVVIPAGVTSIGNNAFYNCTGLKSVIFTEGFEGTLGSSSFSFTTALETLVLVEGIEEIPYQCFYGSGVTSVVIPDSVTSIAGRGFSQNSKLTTVTISENSSLATLGSAFNGTKITSIYLPKGVKITDSPFSSCNNLETIHNFQYAVIETSSGLNVIPNNFFNECRALKQVIFPNGITTIGSGVFGRCGALELVAIPSSVTSINKGVFPGTNDWLSPKNAVIFYCGGDANELLALTDDGSGNVSAFLKDRITAGAVVDYSGINAEYAQGVIVNNANVCDIYYAGQHLDNDEITLVFVDENGNEIEKSFYAQINVMCDCGRGCGVTAVVETISPIFTTLGYSTPMYGNSGALVIGFMFNSESVVRYTELSGETLSFGVFAVLKNTIGTEEAVNADGSSPNGVINANLTEYDLASFDLKIVGFTTPEHKALEIAMGVYVITSDENGAEVSYLQAGTPKENDKYCFVTYNSVA